MKLATLNDGTRDGCLALVSRDLKLCIKADDIAPTLRAALDDWDYLGALLAERYETLNSRPSSRAFEFDPSQCMAPLPRAVQWLCGSPYLSHAERLRGARGAEMPRGAREEPMMYQGAPDALLGPREDLPVADAADGADLEAVIVAVLGDVPMGVRRERAGDAVRLLMLANTLTLRALMPAELERGFGPLHAKACAAFAPCAVTPDELGGTWDGRRLHLPVAVHVNDSLLGRPDAGSDMSFDFPRLIVHAARTRRLGAGTLLGAGPVSNRDTAAGVACLAEKRALEIAESGEARTPLLAAGDRVRIDITDAAGRSIFGAIDQAVTVARAPAAREDTATVADGSGEDGEDCGNGNAGDAATGAEAAVDVAATAGTDAAAEAVTDTARPVSDGPR